MTYRIIHATTYHYSTPAALSQNDVRLTPRCTPFQELDSHHWITSPQPDRHNERTDYFGNTWHSFAFEQPHRELRIESHSDVSVVQRTGVAGDGATGGWEPFLLPSPFVPTGGEYFDYAQRSFPAGSDRLTGLIELTERLFADIVYDPEATEISTPVSQFFHQRRGVCQDFAHLALACLRSIGIPARYVSGYLNTTPPPGKEKVVGADASHAWIAAWCDGLGWVDLDPTNGIAVADNHITVAWGRDYGDVPPLRGVVLGGGAATLTVEVTVTAA